MGADVLAMLAGFCDPERKRISTPFSATLDGRIWACGTNGHILVAVPHEPELRRDEYLAGVIPSTPATHEAPLAVLRRWAGRERRMPCGICCGACVFECDCPSCVTRHPCEACDGKGDTADPRPGLLLHGVINRDYLRRVLATVPCGVESIRFQQAHAKSAYAFRADNWLALVMPRLPDSAPANAPRFYAQHHAAGGK